jgi:hypothetical protein
VDDSGDAYVTGYAGGNLPTTLGAYQVASPGGQNAFLTKFDAAGSRLLYSTYLGGSGFDVGRAIAVDGAGNAYVTGDTQSTNFPIKNAFQTTNAGAGQTAFVAKLNPALSGPDSLVYSSYIGGSTGGNGDGVVVDGAGNAYVTGNTYSLDFPTTPNAFQRTRKTNKYKGSIVTVPFMTKVSFK